MVVALVPDRGVYLRGGNDGPIFGEQGRGTCPYFPAMDCVAYFGNLHCWVESLRDAAGER